MTAGVQTALTGTAETAEANQEILDEILGTDWVAEKQAAVDAVRAQLEGMLPAEEIAAIAEGMMTDVTTIPDDPFAELTSSFQGAADAITAGMDVARDALNEAIQGIEEQWLESWDLAKQAVDDVRESLDLIPRVITITVEYEEGENKQHGGPVIAGHRYLVGEAGPELFIPDQSGMILPNEMTRAVLGGRGDNVSYPTVNVDIGIQQAPADAWAMAELTAARLRNEVRYGGGRY